MRKAITLEQADYDNIVIDKRPNGVAVLTLKRSDRADRMNSFDDILSRELGQLPAALQEDPSVHCAIITGSGDNFSVGGDMSGKRVVTGIRRTRYDLHMVESLGMVKAFLALDKPVISAVKGYALGHGCTVALLADIVIGGQSAKFGDPHVWNVALTAGDGNSALWPLLVGPQAAKYYLLTGEFVSAEEAFRIGLIHRVVEDDEVMNEALRIADRLAAGPPLAIRSTKASIQRYVNLIVDAVQPFSVAVEGFVFNSDDVEEAMAAWREKRPPNFTGMDALARSHEVARSEKQP